MAAASSAAARSPSGRASQRREAMVGSAALDSSVSAATNKVTNRINAASFAPNNCDLVMGSGVSTRLSRREGKSDGHSSTVTTPINSVMKSSIDKQSDE